MCDASKVAKISVILLHNCLKVVMELWITIRYDNYDIHGSRLTAFSVQNSKTHSKPLSKTHSKPLWHYFVLRFSG